VEGLGLGVVGGVGCAVVSDEEELRAGSSGEEELRVV